MKNSMGMPNQFKWKTESRNSKINLMSVSGLLKANEQMQMNTTRPQSSMLLNVNDPIQVHLLVETALGDSNKFEILSQQEVDDLKKHVQALTQRIEQTRQNLAIQSKYRDAAISMSKLYSPSRGVRASDGSDKKQRRSILGHRSTNSMQEADAERLTSERKCEELAAELWSLEKRLMEPQNRLLRHTAGILQMTHKGPKKLQKGANGVHPGGIPGSPESMYTYSNARSSMEQISDEMSFDERSLYKDAFGELNGRDSFCGAPPKAQGMEQMQMIAKTEQKLEDLNRRLREVIVKANPNMSSGYGLPPLARTNSDGRPTETGETLQSHLDYLERSIATIDQQQNATIREQQKSEEKFEETINGMNRDIHDLLRPYNEDRAAPPQLTGIGLQKQLRYFQESMGDMEVELSQAGSKNTGMQGNVEQTETVLMGLWDIIQSGEVEIRRRKQERRMTRSAQGLAEDGDDMSPDDESDPHEPFSLQAFSAKVQWLYAEATRLKDQKKVLQRQIKQQRELNSKSDATKDADMASKTEELGRINALLRRTEMDGNAVREQLSLVMEKLDEARQQERLRDQTRGNDESAAVRQAQAELEQRNATISALEEELQELKDDHSISAAEIQTRILDSETRIAVLTEELAVAATAQASQQALVTEKEQELREKEKEMEGMNMKLAELQTEVTIARAELDGAYGSRAQRAAEVAANPAIQKELDDLSKKNASLAAEIALLKGQGSMSKEADEKMQTLKKELEETIEEYELMTKASIEWEKDREMLEGTIDKLRDEREGLESQLSDEKVRWLGMQSPGLDGQFPGAGNTSTTVLKNEFKKMMRDTRADNQRALRVCFLSSLLSTIPKFWYHELTSVIG
jgi:chromosome segregation ATPase